MAQNADYVKRVPLYRVSKLLTHDYGHYVGMEYLQGIYINIQQTQQADAET